MDGPPPERRGEHRKRRRRCAVVVEEISDAAPASAASAASSSAAAADDDAEPCSVADDRICDCRAVAVPASDEAAMQSVLLRRGEYSGLEDTPAARQAEFQEALARCEKLTFRQALDLRGWALKEKVMKNHWRLLKLAPRMVEQWQRGAGVLQLSERYDLPPVAILRHAVEHRLGTRQAAKIAMASPDERLLSAREAQEFSVAQKADIVNRVDCSSQAEAAEEFEASIQALLQSMGMRFTTQEELIAQQTAALGRAVSTPDFLLEAGQQTLVVNGCAVQWLEAKNFYGPDCKMAARQLQKQTTRYVDRFGPGAVVFSCGFASSLQVDPRIQIIGFDELQQGVQVYTKAQYTRSSVGAAMGTGPGTSLAKAEARGEKRKKKRKSYT